ncbi:MAG: hypothetical protein U9Q03_01225 [Patescibacteria group bacterium]|nr:hypothetical protein [Patescibacteria group bacterium]
MNDDNDKLIDSMLGDLFELDSELKENESELRQTVERLLEHKLDVSIDKKFVDHLRKHILMTSATGPQQEEIKSVSVREHLRNLTLLLGGSAVLAAFLLVVVSALSPGGLRIPWIGPSVPVDRVLALGPEAFGSLASAGGVLGAPEGTEQTTTGFGGGGIPSAISARPIGMPAPEFEQATFTYVGEPLEEIGESVTVYRRIKGVSTSSLASAFAKRDNRLFDLGDLSGLQMRNATLSHVQDSQEYWVHLDFREGVASVNMDERSQVRNDMESAREVTDDELIALADAFLDRYGIDRSPYGESEVDHRWRNGMAEEDASYFPAYIGVVYPTMVGDEVVVGWDGAPVGMRVNINAMTKTVQGVHMISVPRFESSAYLAESDFSRIVSLAENGGFTGTFYLSEESGAELDLGTPSLMYFQHYVHDSATGTSNELYVPALFFPIQDPPTELGTHRKYVVVPLTKELLDQRDEPVEMVMPDVEE